LLSLACSFDLEIEQLDVVTAFLNDDVDYDIYMYPLSCLKIEAVNGVRLECKLHRSLCGIKHAPRSWQALLSLWLVSYGVCQSLSYPSLYTLVHDKHSFALAVYVDECLLIGKKCRFLMMFFFSL
jgi:hypothetical protein